MIVSERNKLNLTDQGNLQRNAAPKCTIYGKVSKEKLCEFCCFNSINEK